MGWVWWLMAPLVATTLAAVATWWANRPRRPLTSEQAVLAHHDFLEALADLPAHPAQARGPQRR